MSVKSLDQHQRIHIGYGSDIKAMRPYPPCRVACPVHTDVQGYVGLIAQGRYAEAFEVIRAPNPLPSTCAFICNHPCEQACRRCDLDEPVAVRHLKRFAVEHAAEYRRQMRASAPQTRRERVAIIGSGPSGLTAANDLADLGYKVSILEQHAELGGMLATAIPPYRLPRAALREDIEDILGKGIDFKTNCEIGRDVSLSELAAEWDAVLIAVGLSQSRTLAIPGVDGPGVYLALPFLTDVALGRKVELGDKVLAIGGGNVAIDVARSARRLGHEKIEMVCLESAEEMPAWEWEIAEALEEGIKITHRWGPKAVRRTNGRVAGLEVVAVKAVFDETGRFNPTFHEDQTSFIEADAIVITIGQMSDLSFLRNSPVALNERGQLIWDPETQMTGTAGVFASGEVVTGPGSAIEAVASGHRAAKAIHIYLEGGEVRTALVEEQREKIEALPEDVREQIVRQPRERIELIGAETRCSSFAQFEIGYDELAALTEARRCRSCGAGAIVDAKRCSACLTCVRICPYHAPVVIDKAQILPERCQACGLCGPECPGRAIRMIGYDVDEIRERMTEIIGPVDADRKRPTLVAFVCGHHAGVDQKPLPENIRQVRVHCVSRIDLLDVLKAFECGADGAYVIGCRDGDCKYEGVNHAVKSRVDYARRLLAEMGLSCERLGFYETDTHPDEAWHRAAEEMTDRVKALGLR